MSRIDHNFIANIINRQQTDTANKDSATDQATNNDTGRWFATATGQSNTKSLVQIKHALLNIPVEDWPKHKMAAQICSLPRSEQVEAMELYTQLVDKLIASDLQRKSS